MTARWRVYAMPVLGRYGLTHGLLAWARCRLWCRDHGVPMLAPNWFKIRVGPLLRGERDSRMYFRLFHSGGAIAGAGRLALLVRSERRAVGQEWPEMPQSADGSVVLCFHNALKDNEKKSFHQVRGHGLYLRRELLAITRRRYWPEPASERFIAIHVRLGDFIRPSAAVQEGATNTSLPLEWFVDRLAALRTALGVEVPAIVFSDGRDSELASLLELEHVRRSPKQESITDLLQMGHGACVISSGSGFSLWGAFLGDVPRLCHPGQLIVSALSDAGREIESDFGAPLPRTFVDAVRTGLS